ncbi:MAG: stage II sporulation protein M [Treponema sp.]|nr:stage II sporulation protein M [Treponema sp.]
MTESAFRKRREASWKEFEMMIGGGRREIRGRASEFPAAFRGLTQDLNTARAHGFDAAIIERLNILVSEGSQILYGQYEWSFRLFARFVLRTFPRKVRSHWRGIGAAFLVFYGLAFFSAFLCVRFPDLVYEFISESQAESVAEMYNPESGHFLLPPDVSSNADMFGFYIYNNISIAFRTFAGGVLAGIGSLFILSLNGIFLGAAAAHIINLGFAETFFPFIIGHGSFELTAIILSAYAGLLLGYRFFIPGGLSRGAALRKAGRDALPLVTGSALFLIAAAVIEAFWSSRHTLPSALRLGAGAAGWALVGLYLFFTGRKGDDR